MLAWLSFVVNLLTYWAERLFVWSADQNLQGNLGFMIFVFGVYLALMVLFTLDLKAKDRN
jgi:succinate-acetate transporter protein